MSNDNQNERYPEIHIDTQQFINSAENVEARIRQAAETGRLISCSTEDIFLDEIETMTAIAKTIERQVDDNSTRRMIFEYIHQCLLKAEVFRA